MALDKNDIAYIQTGSSPKIASLDDITGGLPYDIASDSVRTNKPVFPVGSRVDSQRAQILLDDTILIWQLNESGPIKIIEPISGAAQGGFDAINASLAAIDTRTAHSPQVGADVVAGRIVIGIDGLQYQNTSGGNLPMPASFPSVGFTEYSGAYALEGATIPDGDVIIGLDRRQYRNISGADAIVPATLPSADFERYLERHVRTLADLKALTEKDESVFMAFRSELEPVGGGNFRFDDRDLSGLVARDPLEGVYVAPDSDPTGASGLWVREVGFSGAVTPSMFGGASQGRDSQVTGTPDSAPQVQAMIDFVRGSFFITNDFAYKCDLEGAIWRIGSSLNLSGIRQPGFRFGNGSINMNCTGKIGLDFIGSQSCFIHDLDISCGFPVEAQAAIVYGRNSTGAICPSYVFSNVNIDGFFSKAAIINIASEVDVHEGCVYINRWGENAVSDSVCAIFTSNRQTLIDYVGDISSDYQELITVASGNHSNILHNLNGIEFKNASRHNILVDNISQTNPAVLTIRNFNPNSSTLPQDGERIFLQQIQGMISLNHQAFTIQNFDMIAGTFELEGVDGTALPAFVPTNDALARAYSGAVLVMSGVRDFFARSSYLLNYGGPSIIVDTKSGGTIRNIIWDGQTEAFAPIGVRFDVPDTGSVLYQNLDFTFSSHNQKFETALISVNGGANVRFDGLGIRVVNMSGAPNFKAIDNRNSSNVSVRNGRIIVPLEAALNEAEDFALYEGVMAAMDRANVTITYGGNFNSGISIINTDDSPASGPTLNFYKNSDTPANNDRLGALEFDGNDANLNITRYAEISGAIQVGDDGSEGGRIDFRIIDDSEETITAQVFPIIANGQSGLRILAQRLDMRTLERIMIGPDGSGPDGVGAALYIADT